MTPTRRRVLQVAVAGLGLILGGAFVVVELLLPAGVHAAADGGAGRVLLLATVGVVLEGIGLIGMTLGIALGLPPAISPELEPGGFRGRKRAGRQIAGAEPYREDEVVRLRILAEHAVASSRKTPADGVKVFGAVLVFTGLVLSAPNFVATNDAVLVAVMASLVGVALLVAGVQIVIVRRLTRQGVANAEAFLHRTQPTSPTAASRPAGSR